MRCTGVAFVFEVPHVAARDHADEQTLCIHDRESAHALLAHEPGNLAESRVRTHGVGIVDDGVLGTLHPRDLLDLIFDRTGAVDDAHAAFSREGDGEFALRHGVHGGGQNGNIQGKARGKMRAQVHFTRKHSAPARQQEHVIE